MLIMLLYFKLKGKELSYTIRHFSEKVRISAHTLWYYYKEGLLSFVKMTSSGKRIYVDSDLEFIAVIPCLKNRNAFS